MHSSSTRSALHNDCYFSLVTPASHAYSTSSSNHFSLETPALSPSFDVLSPETPSEPTNPLLAARPAPQHAPSFSMDASKFLQLQTRAAYSTTRPQTQPVQDVLDVSPDTASHRSSSDSSDSSSSSTSSSRSDSASPQFQLIRCCRCHRTAGLGSKSMISFGLNSYYCSRCASIVGYST